MLTDKDWATIAQGPESPGNYAAYQLANDAEEYGEKALWWLVVSPDFEDEIAGPFATREECDRKIESLEVAIAEAHADPYPDRMFPEAEMN